MNPALRRVLPAVLGLALLTGCGSRLSQDELTALNGGTSTVTQGAGVDAPADAGVVATAPGAVPGTAPGTAPGAAPGTLPVATPGAGGATPAAGAGTGAANPAATAAPASSGKPGGAVAAAVKTDNKPITICSVSELGGPAGAALAQGVNGLQAWLGDVNSRGGVNGHPIRLIVKDSGSDPNVALSHARACVENEGAVALVASMAPFTSRGLIPYLESKGVPAIGGDCGSTAWNDSAVFYNQCATVESNVWGLAYEAARSGAANKKFGFLYCQEARTCAEGKSFIVDQKFAQANGLELAYSKQFSLTQLDFTSECSAMKAAGVTSVLAIVDPSGIQRMGQSCARQGFNPIWVEPYAAVYPETPTKAGLGNIRLLMPVLPFCCLSGKDAENPTYQRFVTDYGRYGGKAPGPAGVIGFTAALLFERFLDEVAKTTPTVTSAALLKAAGGIKKETLGGVAPPINLTVGQKTPDSRCWYVMVARDGGAFTVPDGLKLSCRK